MKIQSSLLTASLALIASTSATSVAKTYDINVRPPPSLAKSKLYFSNLGQFDERTIVPALPELNAVGIEDNIVRKCNPPPAVHTLGLTYVREGDTSPSQQCNHLILPSIKTHSQRDPQTLTRITRFSSSTPGF